MKRLNELYSGQCKVWTDGENNGHGFVIPGYRDYSGRRLRINVLAMGDVGGTMTLAMRLTGADIIAVDQFICVFPELVLIQDTLC